MTTTLKIPAGQRDHRIGSLEAPVIIVEYADYQSPSSLRSQKLMQPLLHEFKNDLCYVYRHFPQIEKHKHSAFASMAAEAADLQEHFWQMHHLLFEHSSKINAQVIQQLVHKLDLDLKQFIEDLESDEVLDHIRADMASAEESGVTDVPTFFFNGIIYEGELEIKDLRHEILNLKKEQLMSI